MGCGGSKAAGDPPSKPRRDSEKGPEELRVSKHPQVSFKNNAYFLDQSFALVRHGDRLDHTKAWENYPDRVNYPNDSPLTKEGFDHATEVGHELKKSGKQWGLIIASPYLRCAQTASCIAQVLKLPIHFDLDMGEVFDNISLRGDCTDKPQHRDPVTLRAKLKPDFPDVDWIRDENGDIKIEGQLQKFPENFDFARMRYAYKVKKLVQKASSQLMSIVIVSHGDAVSAVCGMMKEDWSILKVNYTAYALSTRKVKVLEAGSEYILQEEPVYTDDNMWEIKCSPGLVTKVMTSEAKKKQAHQEHQIEMREMEKQARTIHTDYKLETETEIAFGAALTTMGANDSDRKAVLQKAKSVKNWARIDSEEGGQSPGGRILCSPDAADASTNEAEKDQTRI